MESKCKIFWFRRDLRLNDNAGLYEALSSGSIPVIPIFIFDKHILDKLPVDDSRVNFIHSTIQLMNEKLQINGSGIKVYYGTPEEVWSEIIQSHSIHSVYANEDYEPYAVNRDEKIKGLLAEKNIAFHSFKDHVIFDKKEVVKDDGKPYTVFTPYKRKWMDKIVSKKEGNISYYLKPYPTEKYFSNFAKMEKQSVIELNAMGFTKGRYDIPSPNVSQSIIFNYDKQRDYPGINGTSKLGIHFRFGTISVREKALKALSLNMTFLNELIWRDFYSMIIYNFPHVVTHSFRPEYDLIEWDNNLKNFEAWKNGLTGYPIVDAGMRELNATGYMHNRVRMITASFLTKHLLIDWRWGEAYFAEKLLDFDLSSNNGGWQWAAGSGTDAAPYFRIFNPTSQTEKFDKKYDYIKKWVPEFETVRYPKPIVEHKEAREKCLRVYKEGLAKGK